MSYGQDFDAIHGRVAWMIDRILKGARPNDIPVEEQVRIRFIINMKTAKAMGLTIPPIALLQATELIE
jgi:putative tryptophan/tyrosine transport system substrate-binding protein